MIAAPLKTTPLEFFSFRKAAGTMRSMIRQASNNPAILGKAIEIVAPVRGGGYVDEAKALFEFVRDQIRYTSDPHAQDIYRDPLLTLELSAGDCNNKVVLGCSLAKAVGFPTRMVFVFRKAQPDMEADFPFHVLYQVDVTKHESRESRWISCETIPVPSGKVSGPDRYLDFGQQIQSGFPEIVEVD